MSVEETLTASSPSTNARAGIAALQGLAACGTVALIILTPQWQTWDLWRLALIASLAVVSDLMYVETGARFKISGCHLALTLAAVLLGGGPAALIGVTTITVGWLRSREAAHYFRNNLVTFACFPFVAGLFFQGIVRSAHLGQHSPSYYPLVFAAFVLSLGLNFLGVFGYQSHLDRTPLWRKLRETILPLLSAELFSGLMTMVAAFVAVSLGVAGLLLNVIVLLVFQYLVGELLKSQQRGERLERMATTDALTGLANREAFRTALEARIEEARAATRRFGVLLMDLDHFKELNDTLGHQYGDDLLRQLGPRLANAVGTRGIVARLGGDEFAVLVGPADGGDRELELVAGELLEAAQHPFWLDELSIEVGASIGIARFPADGEDGATLLRHADTAMYQAKAHQSGTALYSSDGENAAAQRLTILSDFRKALRSQEILLHYQPIVHLATLIPQGVEGLVRWEHPERGLLSPGAFVGEVERTGLIGPMTRQILERAISQAAEWRRAGLELCVSVNLSVRNLLDRDLLQDIERLLSRYSVPPGWLKLEITESMLMSDPERSRQTVTGLSEMGVQISVDDFGTGYSSLANLRSLPLNELKIDRSFVTPMLRDDSDLIIVRSTINLAHDLGLAITAEGVEDEQTLRALSGLGCDFAQGFHLARPLPAAEIPGWVEQLRRERVPPVRRDPLGAAR